MLSRSAVKLKGRALHSPEPAKSAESKLQALGDLRGHRMRRRAAESLANRAPELPGAALPQQQEQEPIPRATRNRRRRSAERASTSRQEPGGARIEENPSRPLDPQPVRRDRLGRQGRAGQRMKGGREGLGSGRRGRADSAGQIEGGARRSGGAAAGGIGDQGAAGVAGDSIFAVVVVW